MFMQLICASDTLCVLAYDTMANCACLVRISCFCFCVDRGIGAWFQPV